MFDCANWPRTAAGCVLLSPANLITAQKAKWQRDVACAYIILRVEPIRIPMGVRTYGQMGSAEHPGKMDEKLKSENMQKEQFPMFMLYFESNQGRQV